MRWGGVFLLLFLIWHLLEFTIVKVNVGSGGRSGRQPVPAGGGRLPGVVADGHLSRRDARPRHAPRHGIWSATQTLGWTGNHGGIPAREDRRPSWSRRWWRRVPIPPLAVLFGSSSKDRRPLMTARDPGASPHRGRPDRRHQGAERPDRRASGPTRKFEAKLVNPANRRKLYGRSSSAPGWPARRPRPPSARPATTSSRSATRTPRAARTRSPPRAASTPRRTTWSDGDSRLPAVLRHGQGRRLPLARGQRLPAGRGQRQHHRPVRGAGRAVRPRVRRPARQPLVRRRAGVPHLLRPRPDGPAAAHRRLPGARAPGRRRHGRDVHPPRDARRRSSSTAGPAASSPATWSPARSRRTWPTRSCWPPAATATSSTCPPTRWAATSPPPGGPTARAPMFGQPLLHPDPPHLHPGVRRPPVQADADERVAAQRRPHLGAQAARGLRQGPARDPRGGPRLLPGADLPLLRQPGPPRHRLAARPSTCATRAAGSGPRSATSAGRLPRLRRRHRAARAGRRSRRSTATSSTCTPGSPARTRTRCRCGSTPPSTTRWAGCGSTTTCRPRSRACTSIGEANFSDHGANRLGASALMQGLADGYFVLPNTIRDYLAAGPYPPGRPRRTPRSSRRAARSRSGSDTLLVDQRRRARVDSFHKRTRPHHVGVLRHGAHRGGPAQGHRPDPRRCARSSGATCGCSAPPRRSTSPGEGRPGRRLPRARRADVHRRPAPTRVLRRPLPGRVARPRTARRCATTTSTPTSPAWELAPVRRRGRDGAARPAQGRPRVRVHRAEAAELQVNESDSARSGARTARRPTASMVTYAGRRRLRGHVVPGDARRPQRAAHRRGRRAGRLRPRLPRGHLRHVRADDQRPGPRPRGHHDLPAAHALVQRRRHDHHRAVAGRRRSR